MKDKAYFQKYYQDHKEEYRKRNKRWCKGHPEEIKAMKDRYKERVKAGKVVRVLGKRLKKPHLKPFKSRISPELLAKIEENTRINNERIKFYNIAETRDTYLVQSLLKMKEIKI
ncbi:unnamed protein product [marine sediment metagenome]|uniref:Uncharacterized protein n=1 Tax=marine sediment metagenome TaxID=412755 RepID=X1A207_9ZZZZ